MWENSKRLDMTERGLVSLDRSSPVHIPRPYPVVAIVGRPNVGKSTLFNRLIGARKALVHDLPGVTRDRIFGEVRWGTHVFMAVDTGGFDSTPSADGLTRKIQQHLRAAIHEADLVLFVVDGRDEIHPMDREIARLLRRTGKQVITAVNKIEGIIGETSFYNYTRLGMEPLFPISALHGTGIGELLDALVLLLPESVQTPGEAAARDTIKVAIVGRPNVGKSTLLNAILGEERHLVHETPGTTRDAVDALLSTSNRDYLFIDTAGIRRRGKLRAVVEKYSVIKALQGIDRCDVTLLMLDAKEGVTGQDAHIGGYILDRGKGAVILLNKWDLVAERQRRNPKKYIELVQERLHHLSFAPIVRVSALTGYGLKGILPVVDRVACEYRKRVPTHELNRFFEETVAAHPPSGSLDRQIRFYYVTQVSVGPPTFVFFTNTGAKVHFSYQRYLVNQLRARFGYEGTPIRLLFRKKQSRH